ncbi:MAG: MFS transporter [Candidatus Dojkabacteria bacterium]
MEIKPEVKKKRFGNVFFIGLMTFFGGISQDIFLPILPIYLSSVLGLSKEFIGLTEGLVTSSASIFRVVSGFLSDKFKKRKAIIFIGYFLSMISRPLLAIISSGPGILFLRFVDGVGKGAKDSPKDALIADSTDVNNRGKGFGVARALDTLGSVVGPLFLFVLLVVLQDDTDKYLKIFLLSAIPLFFTLGIIIFKVRESPVVEDKVLKTETKSSSLSKKFFIFLAIMILFSLGNSSDTFLILRAQNVGVALLAIPLVYALFNLVYASASIPLGSLSDRIGREKVIIIGWVAYLVAYLGFGLANQTYQIWLLFAFYGIYYATTEGVAKALVADLVESSHRGRAYGIYNATIGLITLPAGIIAGYLWDKVSASAPFIFGSIMAGLATICLFVFIRVYYRRVSIQ